MTDLIRVTYQALASAPFDVEQRAKAIALSQTTDTWTPVGAAAQQKLERRRGRVLDARPIERQGEAYRGVFTVGFPAANTELDIATALTMVFGKVSMDGRIRVLDIEFPEAFLKKAPGPKHGVPGLRKLAGVPERPLAMAIFKPCVGLSPKELGEMVYQLALGGVDLVKDDEILPDLDLCPTEARLAACLEAAERARRETGQRTLYAVNLTGPVDKLREKARRLVSRGANCLLFNALAYGYPALEMLAADPEVRAPIMAHPALAGAVSSSSEYGIAYRVTLGTLMRVAGADIVLFPSSYGTVALPHAETEGIRRALTEPLGRLPAVFPGPSAGIHPGLVPRIIQDYGREVIINAGGGVHGHPGGAQAGARAFRQAIDLALAGREASPQQAPKELAQALERWGR